MIREMYDQLSSEREGFLQQARLHSELTVPSLIPMDDSSTGSYTDLYRPWQSVGAFGVNAIANKIVGALIPANEPFFRFVVNTTADELAEMGDEQLAEVDASLSELEQDILLEFSKRGDRAAITEAIKHLIVGGNAVLSIGEDQSAVYPLSRFVAVRDGNGNLVKLITKDCLSYETFKGSTPALKDIHAAHEGARKYPIKTIEVYTEMCLKDNKWMVREEAAGKIISSSTRSYPKDKPPMVVLRFNRIDGQSYGRGYVESLYGDLNSLEVLSKAMVEASAISARCVTLVNPNGLTSMRRFEQIENGGVMPGNAGDVTMARADKGSDLAVVAPQIERLTARLNQAFMLVSSVQRDAERVTATEITALTNEVESVLGGLYAVLAEEFQRPYVSRLVAVLDNKGIVPSFKEGLVDVAIITGTSAIGRGIDKERMMQFIQSIGQALGAEALQKYINVPVAVQQLAASFGIRASGLIKSSAQIEEEMQAAQQSAMMQAAAPQAIAGLAQVNTQQVKNDATQENPSQQPTV